MQTVEATIDERGNIRLHHAVTPPRPRRALVTILDEDPVESPSETALLSESALADWSRPEEDAAWSHFQSESV